MDNNIDNIDDLFREGFADYAETPPPAVWQALERRLDNDKKRRAFPLRWFWYIGILIVAVVLGAGMLYLPDFGKETTQVATAEGKVDVLPPAGEAAADKVKSSVKESAAHTMPAPRESANQQNNGSSSAQQADEIGNKTEYKQKNNNKELKIAAKRSARKQQTDVQEANNKTTANTTMNAAATGTSMYSYDDFEQAETTENNEDDSKATQRVKEGYVVSKKRKNKMVVVEQLPEGIGTEESKNNNNEISGSAAMKGRGVQIAKASAGNATDVPSDKIVDMGVAKSATIPEPVQDVRKSYAGNGGAAKASSEDNKRVEHVAATSSKVGNRVPKKQKNGTKNVAKNTDEQQRVVVQNKPTSGKIIVADTSKGSEKKTAAPKVIASVLVGNKTVTKKNMAVKEVAPKNKATSGQQIGDNRETASVAGNTGKVSAAIAKNTTVAIGASSTNSTDAASSKSDADKRTVAQNKAVGNNKTSVRKVVAKHAATADINTTTNSVVAGKRSVVNKKRAPKNDKAELKKVAIAEEKDRKSVTANSEVAATSAAPTLAVDKKVLQAKGANDVAKKEAVTANEIAKNEKVKVVGEKPDVATVNTGNAAGNKSKKQLKKYGDAITTKSAVGAEKGTSPTHTIAAKKVTERAEKGTTTANATPTKSTEKAKKGTTPSHTIAVEKITGISKNATGSKQKGVAKVEAHAAEDARVNVASPATAAKNLGRKQGGIAASNTLTQAGGKWLFNNSLPEETTAADYVMKKDIKPLLQASEIVVEAANKKVDSTIAKAADSAGTMTADSVKSDSTTNNKRFVLGVKGGMETGMVTGGANKAVVSPYLQYKFSERLSLMVQPALKMAGLSTRNVGVAANYYEVNPGTGSYKLIDSALLILVLTGDTLWNRNYEYTERYDSVVKTNKTGGNYMEIELPLLLQYKVTQRLSVYGGVNTVYGRKMGIAEHTYVAKAMPKTGYVNTRAQYYAPAPTPTGTGITYTGSPLSGYTGPQYPSETGGMFRFGYMFGLSYELRKRWLADVLVQQCIAQQNLVAGYNVNRPLSVPYFRFTLGYRLSK
jgi:hypothetical protein